MDSKYVRTSMELHLVHWKTCYGNLSNAQKYRDGLGVLGLLFDVSRKARDFRKFNRHDKLSVRIQTRYLPIQFFRFLIIATFVIGSWAR